MRDRSGTLDNARRSSDGYQGWTEEARFDRIILTAAPPEIPQALVDQLKPGGRMVAPVGGSPIAQSLIVVDKMAVASSSGPKRSTRR